MDAHKESSGRASKQEGSGDRTRLGELKTAANGLADSTNPLNSACPADPVTSATSANSANSKDSVNSTDPAGLNRGNLDDQMKNWFMNTMRRLYHIKFSMPTSPQGVTPAESRVVHMVMNMESRGVTARPSAVAARMHTTPSALSQILKTLEKKGLIARHRAHDDFRAVTLELTDAGRAIAREAEQLHVEHAKAVIDYVGEEDFAHLLRTIDKILEFHESQSSGQLDGDDFLFAARDLTCGASLQTTDGAVEGDAHDTAEGSSCCPASGATESSSGDSVSCSAFSPEGGSPCV